MTDAARIIAIFGLILGTGVFVAAEYALVTARRSRLEESAEKGRRAARVALRLMDEPVRFISTLQVGITVFGIALGAVGEPLVSRYLDFLPRGVAFAGSFIILTYLSVVVDDEQLHYCGAVSGGGNRFSNFEGSARTACNCSA